MGAIIINPLMLSATSAVSHSLCLQDKPEKGVLHCYNDFGCIRKPNIWFSLDKLYYEDYFYFSIFFSKSWNKKASGVFFPWYLDYLRLPINIKSKHYFCVKRIIYSCHKEWKAIHEFVFYLGVLQISSEINSDSDKLTQLQKIIHQQQDNLSQQLSEYRNFPVEEEFLKSQISSLLKRQGQMAIKLCQELIIHTSGNQDLLTSQIKSVALV